ncbi:MAG: HEPN family nuclease [Acidimicrobiales bacterium]|nr:HEPN family nuclease [Acidimicrobiales bacterium]
MEYSRHDFIGDFAKRTLKNLDFIQAEAAASGVYPVTQLWNSLLGLIVLPSEADLESLQIPMSDLWSDGWPHITTTGREREVLRDLMVDLRNAVAHFNVEFVPGTDREIKTVTVWTRRSNREGKPIEGTRRWEGKLTVKQLDHLARRIAAIYVKEFAHTSV